MLGHDLDLVETASQVHLSEDSGTSHTIDALVDLGYWVSHFLRELVEFTVVDAEAETSIVFPREEDTGSKRRACGLDPAIVGVVVKLFFQLLILGRAHAIDAMARWDCIGNEVDAMVSCSRRRKTFGQFLGEYVLEPCEKALDCVRYRALGDGA